MRARRSPLSPVWAVFAVVLAALLQIPASASADPALPAGFQDQVVLEKLDQPTNFRFAPDGRIFVAEKPGKILVFKNFADTNPEVFADLRTDVYDNGDRGLLGLALDPKFEEGRPYVYALYTWDHILGDPVDGKPKYGKAGTSGDPDCPTQNTSHSCLVSGRLVRLTASGNHSVAQKVLVEGWCQQFSSHSVGDLQFGPEDALYVSGGDGAAYESLPDYGQLGAEPNPCGDPPGPKGSALSPPSSKGGALRAQNKELLNGKILRIDPSTGKGLPDNPLAGGSDENEKRLVAVGFRNPFRFTFDQKTGEIYTGNVGSSEIEEIDRFQAPPATIYNSGWPCYEGIQRQYQFAPLGLDVCTDLYDAEPGSTSKPFFNYSHGQSVVPNDECPIDSGSAIGGVSFYQGNQFPAEYKGALFFADAVRGCIWVMFPGADGKPDPSTTTRFLRESKIYPGVKIAEGPGGYLYYADLFSDEQGGDGAIHRIVYAPGAPSARLEADPPYGLYGPGPSHSLDVSFDASGSTDPSSEAFSYEWDMDGDGTFELVGAGAKATETATYTEKEQEEREADDLSPNRVVAVRVKDGEGLTSVARVTVYPGDKPPVPQITSPLPSFRWAVGDPIELDASAVDANGDPIDVPLPYYWITRLAHCPDPAHPTACHVHPLQTFAGIRQPEFLAPQHDYPSYIEAILRVSDDRGLSGTTTMKIDPRTVDLSIASDPPGIGLTAGSTEAATPFSIPAIVGSEILLSAPPTAGLNGKAYAFQGWSDGGGRSRPILVTSPTQYTALYAATLGPEQPPRQVSSPPTAGPQTVLRGHPPKRTRSRTALFSFGSDAAGASFRCRLDAGGLVPCRSPRIYRKLKPGRHKVEIVAVDPAGLRDASPIRFSWKIRAPKQRH